MRTRTICELALGLVLAAGPAWALTEADTGKEWVQSPTPQKIRLANILSRGLGGDPQAYVGCLDKTFADPANGGMAIREAAQQCREKEKR